MLKNMVDTNRKEDVKMKTILGTIGFFLMIGGAGASDCGADLLPSAITSMAGLAMMFVAIRIGGEKC